MANRLTAKTVALPYAGEGNSAVQRNGLGEGEAATPHPTEFAETKVMPSPAGGYGIHTSSFVA